MRLAQQVSLDLIWPPSGVPGFVYFGDGGALIKTGISGGFVSVELEVLGSEPDLNLAPWEDVDEGDLATKAGGIRLSAGMEVTNWIPGGNEGLTARHPALHRVRVSAAGRSKNRDLVIVGDGPVESYSIEIWPVSSVSASIVRKRSSGC
ncbi:hypothetical protein CH268_11860 [Rhodococcus sp. 06-1460-1B]|nr:hypothetical protein CH268_11860 [Rhodococcus sp. 06-1460-1B]